MNVIVAHASPVGLGDYDYRVRAAEAHCPSKAEVVAQGKGQITDEPEGAYTDYSASRNGPTCFHVYSLSEGEVARWLPLHREWESEAR